MEGLSAISKTGNKFLFNQQARLKEAYPGNWTKTLAEIEKMTPTAKPELGKVVDSISKDDFEKRLPVALLRLLKAWEKAHK